MGSVTSTIFCIPATLMDILIGLGIGYDHTPPGGPCCSDSQIVVAKIIVQNISGCGSMGVAAIPSHVNPRGYKGIHIEYRNHDNQDTLILRAEVT